MSPKLETSSLSQCYKVTLGHCYTLVIVKCNGKWKGVVKLQDGRGCGGKRINRVNISLTNKMDSKLNKLSVSLGMKKTTLACMLVEMCLDDPVIVSKLQNEFNVHSAYRILPINRNGDTEYLLKD